MARHPSFGRLALITVPLVLLPGIASGRLSNSGYGNSWFDALAKPEAMPPGWVFGAAWTTLYILLGLALAHILHARGADWRGTALALFGAQLIINFAWSPVFFAMHEVRIAFWMIAAMLLLSVLAAMLFARIRKTAALLMLPYIAWLVFAGYLTYGIAELNPQEEALVPPGPSADINS